MADLNELRETVRQHARIHPATGFSDYDEFATGSMVAAFNRLAPADMALPAEGIVSLEVTSHLAGPLPAQDVALLERAFARAVAFIGSAIAHPDSEVQRLSDAMYRQSMIFARPTPRGAIAFLPQRERSIPGMATESIAEQAMVRLAGILPSTSEESAFGTSILGLRSTEVRALREVVDVVRPLAGLSVLLRGAEEVVQSTLTSTQAEDLNDLLTDMHERVDQLPPVVGRLDGMRFRRQMFYLEMPDGRERQGLVDPSLLGAAKELLDRPVLATLERVVKVRRDGSQMRAVYRLVAVEPAPPEPDLFDN